MSNEQFEEEDLLYALTIFEAGINRRLSDLGYNIKYRASESVRNLIRDLARTITFELNNLTDEQNQRIIQELTERLQHVQDSSN